MICSYAYSNLLSLFTVCWMCSLRASSVQPGRFLVSGDSWFWVESSLTAPTPDPAANASLYEVLFNYKDYCDKTLSFSEKLPAETAIVLLRSSLFVSCRS